MPVIDADAHVEESPATFADLHGDWLFDSVAYLRGRTDVSNADQQLLLYDNAARFYGL